MVVVGDVQLIAVIVCDSALVLRIFRVIAGDTVYNRKVMISVDRTVRMGEFLFCVDLIKVVVCLRLVRFRCRKATQIIGTQSRVPGIMIGKLYRTNVSFADVVFSRGKFQIDIPLAGFNACGKLQVEFRRNSCA